MSKLFPLTSGIGHFLHVHFTIRGRLVFRSRKLGVQVQFSVYLLIYVSTTAAGSVFRQEIIKIVGLAVTIN